MKDLRVIFFGTPRFACEILKALIEEKYHIVAVVSQPDKPVGRKRKIMPPPVHEPADAHGIPVLQPAKLRLQADEVLAYQPDLIVTCAYGQMIPDVILDAPAYGCLNIHPSLLPKYRGGAPVHRAVMKGDEETGVCLMEMVHAMDAGDVFARRIVKIDEEDTTETLNLKLEKAGCDLIREALPGVVDGTLKGEPQGENYTLARNIAPEEEKVSFAAEDVNVIYNHIRGLIDWPIAYGVIEGKRIKFYAVRRKTEENDHVPGTVMGFEDGCMKIACMKGYLYVKELQPEGKSRMDAKAFANGAGRALTGKVFE